MQNSSLAFSPLEGGEPSAVKEIQTLIPCYQQGRTVIGTDAFLEVPIWNLTAQAVQKLLAGEPEETVMDWLDEQAGEERERSDEKREGRRQQNKIRSGGCFCRHCAQHLTCFLCRE